MYKLIMNENMKIYRRLSNILLILFLIAISIFTAVFVYKTAAAEPNNWRAEYEQNNQVTQELLEDETLPNFQKPELEKQLKLRQYALAHNIAPGTSAWNKIQEQSVPLITLATLLSVVVAGGIVANEYRWGTIKLLLIRPIHRRKILLAKYLAAILFGLTLIAVLFIVSLTAYGSLFGFDSPTSPYLYIGSEGNVVEISIMKNIIQSYCLKIIEMIMFITLAFMLSVVFRSNALAISVSLLAIAFGPQITKIFTEYSWAKYILFANTDMTMITLADNPFGVSLAFSTAVLAAYFILFNVISWFTFMKRDVVS